MTSLGNKMLVFQSQGLGGGDLELSQKMMRGFLKMLGKQPVKPHAIFFLGDSVKLLIRNSTVLEFLQILEAEGVEILICKAAVEYYALESELAVGKIISTGIWLKKMNDYEVITF